MLINPALPPSVPNAAATSLTILAKSNCPTNSRIGGGSSNGNQLYTLSTSGPIWPDTGSDANDRTDVLGDKAEKYAQYTDDYRD